MRCVRPASSCAAAALEPAGGSPSGCAGLKSAHVSSRPEPPMQLPDQMTAVEITAPGEPGVLKPAQRDMPKVGPDEVLIEVAAAGVNRPDVLQRRGGDEAPPRPAGITGAQKARPG